MTRMPSRGAGSAALVSMRGTLGGRAGAGAAQPAKHLCGRCRTGACTLPPMAVDIRRLGETKDQLGESPCWDADAQAVCWIDSLAGTLWRLDPETGALERHSLPAPVGSIAPCEGDAVVVALKHSLARFDFATGQLQTLARIPVDHEDVRFNDGKCAPWGTSSRAPCT